jgi:hypothetical protein
LVFIGLLLYSHRRTLVDATRPLLSTVRSLTENHFRRTKADEILISPGALGLSFVLSWVISADAGSHDVPADRGSAMFATAIYGNRESQDRLRLKQESNESLRLVETRVHSELTFSSCPEWRGFSVRAACVSADSLQSS